MHLMYPSIPIKIYEYKSKKCLLLLSQFCPHLLPPPGARPHQRVHGRPGVPAGQPQGPQRPAVQMEEYLLEYRSVGITVLQQVEEHCEVGRVNIHF